MCAVVIMNTHIEFMLADTRSFTSQIKYKELLHKYKKYNIRFQRILMFVIAFILLGHEVVPNKKYKEQNLIS